MAGAHRRVLGQLRAAGSSLLGEGKNWVIAKWGALVGQEAKRKMVAVTPTALQVNGRSPRSLLSPGLLISLTLPEGVFSEVTPGGPGPLSG